MQAKDINSYYLDQYENSLKVYRDLKGIIDTAYDEGKMEGLIEGKIFLRKIKPNFESRYI